MSRVKRAGAQKPALQPETAGVPKDSPRAAALRCLIEGKSDVETCAIAGVSRTSLYRWREEPEFAAAYAKLQNDSIREARETLRRYAKDAASTLHTIMNDDEAPPAIRVKAATEMLDRVGISAQKDADRPLFSEAEIHAKIDALAEERARQIIAERDAKAGGT